MGKARSMPASGSSWIHFSVAIVAGFLCWSFPASAYRPFDGTDAAVAKPGEIEIELQPAGAIRQGSQLNLIAPAAVINVGLRNDWEAVFEGRGQFPLSGSEDQAALTDVAAFLKGVLRPGSLQDGTGPSIATEFGVLLPGTNPQHALGASVAGIVSQRWEWGTIHINFATALTREHHADILVGAIVEGPAKWPIRPVVEVFYEDDVGQSSTVSMLGGAIWQVRDNLSFDVGLRRALTNGQPSNEIRAGLTFAFPARLLGAKSP
jgi:hypothetical protein